MKKLNRIAFVVALSLCALLKVSAQEATFDENTLNALKKDSAAWLEGKKIRIVSVDERLENEGKTSVVRSKSTSEFLPPDRYHYIFETTTAAGTERTEYIDIGKESFVRRGDGDWEIFVPSGKGGMGNGTGDGFERPQIETKVVRTLSKNVNVNDQTANLYQTVTTVKYTFTTRTHTNVFIESYWFDNSGRMLKSFEETQYGDTKKSTRSTTEYDYDPNLKIEAPRIKNKPKTNN